MHSRRSLAVALANAFLRSAWNEEAMCRRAGDLMGYPHRWIRPLARRVIAASLGSGRPRHAALAAFICRDRGFHRACSRQRSEKQQLRVADWVTGPPLMAPMEAAADWQLPTLCTVEQLATWLGTDWVTLQRLTRSWRSSGRHDWRRTSNYHYRIINKRFGQTRLIEIPKPRLKEIQRKILRGILDHVPLHDAAHGFRRGASICTFAASHVDRDIVVRLDLQDFFPSIVLPRIQALFRSIGYPEPVADALAGLCTHCTPGELWDKRDAPGSGATADTCRLYQRPHLPQGAPSSPALANLCAYRLDCRLTALAKCCGATYTRYADDLAFSGDELFRPRARRLHLHAAAIVMDEGFRVQFHKTKIMRRGVRQQLAGLVVNRRLNIRRSDYDCLKATLTNCVRHGPATQNRGGHVDFRRHLEGRIAMLRMINPARADKLDALFRQIRW